MEGEENSAAPPRGKGEIAFVEKDYPALVSEHVESGQGQEGGLAAIDMDAHTSCRNRMYNDNVPPPEPAAGGRSRAGLRERPSGHPAQLVARSAIHSSQSAGGFPHQRKERFSSRTCTVAPRKALKSLRLSANLLEMLSRKRIIATRPLRCVAVRREWIRVTAPGSSVTEIGECRMGMISEFERSHRFFLPFAAGGAILRAAHHT